MPWVSVTVKELISPKDVTKYCVKSATQVKKVIRKKKADTFVHTWKKAFTIILSCQYDKKGKSWKKVRKKFRLFMRYMVKWEREEIPADWNDEG